MNYNKIYILLLAACITAVAGAQTNDKQKYSNDGRHKGLDFNISTGYLAGTGDFKKTGAIPVEIGLGKQFNSNLYAGLGTGAWLGTDEGSKPMIPITADAKLMFPLKSTTVKPIFTVRLGYLLNTAEDIKIDGYEYGGETIGGGTVEMSDYIMMQIMPGVQLPVSKTTDFMLSAGYTHSFATKDGGGGGYFTVKVGFNFHKNPNRIKLGPKREKVPTRDKGLQFTLEGNANMSQGKNFGGGGNLVCTYKLNPHFSVGGGAGYELLKPFKSSGYISGYGKDEGNDINVLYFYNNHYQENIYAYKGDVKTIKIFGRGVYRITDHRFSPFVSVDAGIRLYSFDNNMMQGYDDIVNNPSKTAPFVNPAIGLSMRTTKNSYLEIKAGYELAPSIKAQKGYNGSTYVSTSKRSLSQPYVSLGFTHTFGKRGKRLR